jgi:membrane protein DedA with SNARE-associated domain
MFDLNERVLELIREYGSLGVLIGMFLESSVLPIPSELVLLSAGALQIPIASIVVFGSLGSALGSAIGYSIGRYGGRPFIDAYGKYFLITQEKLLEAERWVQKYGNITVFVSRLIPFVPFKVFSISAGILKMSFFPFLLYTFLGMLPRSLILASLGKTIMLYKLPGLIALIVVGILSYYLYKRLKGGV